MSLLVPSVTRSDAPGRSELWFTPALPPGRPRRCSVLTLFLRDPGAVPPVVPGRPVSQSPAVLPDVSRVNESHDVLVPGLRSRAVIGPETVGREAPDGEAHGDGRPVVAVFLDLTVVDAAVGQVGSTNEHAPLEHHQLLTGHHLRRPTQGYCLSNV